MGGVKETNYIQFHHHFFNIFNLLQQFILCSLTAFICFLTSMFCYNILEDKLDFKMPWKKCKSGDLFMIGCLP